MSTLAHSPHHKTALWFVEKGQERNGKGEKKVTALSPLGVCFRGGFKLASKLLGGEEGGTRDYSLKYPVKNTASVLSVNFCLTNRIQTVQKQRRNQFINLSSN